MPVRGYAKLRSRGVTAGRLSTAQGLGIGEAEAERVLADAAAAGQSLSVGLRWARIESSNEAACIPQTQVQAL